MNNKQWEALKAATQGHVPGPWRVETDECYPVRVTRIGPISPHFCAHSWLRTGTPPDATLAASAPDLLAEVERLRGWIALVNDSIQVSRDPWLQRVLAAALNGEEVPE